MAKNDVKNGQFLRILNLLISRVEEHFLLTSAQQIASNILLI